MKRKIVSTKSRIAEVIAYCDTWKEAAVELGICEDVLRREKKIHGFSRTIKAAKKMLEPKEGMECLTKYDPKKEFPSFNGFENLKEETKKLDKLFTDSIGYDNLEFRTNKKCGLVFLTDLHVGNKYTDHKRILDVVEMIRNNEDLYAIDGGDNCDNFDEKKSNPFEHILSVPQQKDFVKTIIKEISDKLIAIIQGCHDEWMFNREKFDLSQYLARHSKGKPLGFGGLITLHVGKQTYRIYTRHKISGYTKNSTLAALIKHLARIKLEDVDVVIAGHFHCYRLDRFIFNGKPTTAMICPSFKITDRYGDKNFMEKSPTNVPMIIFGGEEREILVFDNIEQGLKYL